MKTAVTGFPRIGTFRELKFAEEKYFRKEIGIDELESCAKKIRCANRKLQFGIDYIPSGDFSYYDGLLDTAFLFNIIPERYRKLGLNTLDTYFAAARGYQCDGEDVKALAMKKWFTTNYHYIVPEIDDDSQDIKLVGRKPFDEYIEAREDGYEARPVIIGAFTLLKLTKFLGTRSLDSYVESVIKAYSELVSKFENLEASWIQFDEPCAVCDMNDYDIKLFEKLYEGILSNKGNVKILLQTYFGDIRDIAESVKKLDFDGIGLDFVEGTKSLELVKNHVADKKILFAGVINGRNIHKNNSRETINLLKQIKDYSNELIIGTSCSLMHVPVTTQTETAISSDVLKNLAFAVEKLYELRNLSALFENPKETTDTSYNALTNVSVINACKNLKPDDFLRKPSREERAKLQKESLKLPLFPTTTIGSFPQTADVKNARKALRNGEMDEKKYENLIKSKIADCIAFQEEAGFDVLVHGEFERTDMVEYFGKHLDGFLFTQYGWVLSYGTRCVKPPVIIGDVSRRAPITVKWSEYAQSLTNKPVKGMLTGPVTILNWSFPREDISLRESCFQIALAIREEVLDLEKSGIRIIQIDEAALREKLPLRKADWFSSYLDWAIDSFRLTSSGVKPETQIHTHMCYSEFTDIIPSIDAMDADVITFEASRSNLEILKALKEFNFKTHTGPGVYDIHSPRIPSTDEIYDALKKMLKYIPSDELWINPDCGLKTRGEKETSASLKNLTAAATKLRHDYK